MDRHHFVGCPFYKDDIARTLHKWYPKTSFAKFMRKSIRQLRVIYASTVKRSTEREVMRREESRESTGQV
jgi:hypothetical protein